MTTSAPHYRRPRMAQLVLAGAAAVALLALFGVEQGAVHLTHVAVLPQTPPNLSGGGGFAADDGDDEAQLQQQIAQQQLQQSMQQAEEQNEQAQQQAQQAEQQGQWVEEHPGP